MLQSIAKRVLTSLAAGALLAGAPAWPQDDGQDPAAAEVGGDAAGETAAGAEPDETEAEDDRGGPAVGLDEIPELDEQTYEEDDDDFVPSEEIPVDQSIPFPTDI